ncbi:pro-sigmaK processing inhibitor BofA family protein [Paenibacillus turpanensis]|uniref:pro-sigmaK processing inhibitor BofA family protein n=1 Tax=Paenibacillus turpanensis TaxID=2689078 RepID=UPI001407CD88|nr:pro-sigmaK processing inhibitor BofA family protein [Paenibacillus turpanensis]
MKWIALGVLVLSAVILVMVVLRTKLSYRMLGYAVMNLAAAAIFLYLINLAEGFTHFRLPINAATVLTVGILGVPGIALLAAVKWFVVG